MARHEVRALMEELDITPVERPPEEARSHSSGKRYGVEPSVEPTSTSLPSSSTPAAPLAAERPDGLHISSAAGLGVGVVVGTTPTGEL